MRFRINVLLESKINLRVHKIIQTQNFILQTRKKRERDEVVKLRKFIVEML